MFFNKTLIVGNPQSSVGICTLWSKTDVITEGLTRDKFCLAGNLYTAEGISYLLKNILANPVITNIIVCGQDFFKSGEKLIDFFQGKDIPLHGNITEEAVELLRKNVKVLDLRGREGELAAVLENIPQGELPFAKPLILTDEIEKQDLLTSEIAGFRVEGSLGEAWLRVMDIIIKFGEVKESEHELKQKEALDILSVINDFNLENFLGVKEEDVKKYIDLFFSAEAPKEVEYTYGKRLFRFAFEYVSAQFGIEMRFFINQIDKVVEHLKKSPYSRRVVAGLWNPFTDADSKNPPCLTQITWNVKNGKIYQTCVFRSHDIFGAYPLNALALRKLQEKVAAEVGFEMGDLLIFSQSAHIYENSWKKAAALLEENLRHKDPVFRADRAGYFIISIDKGKKEIIIQHCFSDGRKSKYLFCGNDSATLYKEILKENLVSQIDHAAYLGSELTKAEECLKNNREYTQDAI